MQKIVKLLFPFLLVSGLIFNYSCLSDEEEEQRTFDDEMAELDAMLAKLIDEGYVIDTTEGVYYIVKDGGVGPFPQTGDTCHVEYKLHILNGPLIRESLDYNTSGIIIFLLGETGVPDMTPGWANGIRKMKEGAEIDFFVPSNLAYGKEGSSDIPPFTTLIYRSKMHKLNPVED